MTDARPASMKYTVLILRLAVSSCWRNLSLTGSKCGASSEKSEGDSLVSMAFSVLSFLRSRRKLSLPRANCRINPSTIKMCLGTLPYGYEGMRYYFHILKDRERLRDHDGEEFESLALARQEATQSARDLIAEELRCGRAAPSQWRIQIALEDETIVETVPFAALLLGDHGSSRGDGRATRRNAQELLAQANATFDRARSTTAEIRQHLEELRSGIATLKAFTQYRRD